MFCTSIFLKEKRKRMTRDIYSTWLGKKTETNILTDNQEKNLGRRKNLSISPRYDIRSFKRFMLQSTVTNISWA